MSHKPGEVTPARPERENLDAKKRAASMASVRVTN